MVLSEYNPDWADQFESIRAILQNKLSGIVFRIEHVGSTSIRDLSAKPKIDIQIVIPKGISLNVIIEKLAELGYRHEGDLGCEGREAFDRKDKTVYNSTLDNITHNLYASPENNKELERQILFRDYLRINEEGRIAYEKLKQDIAERAGQNVKKYVMIKETEAREFVYAIVEKARQSLC